MTRRRQALLGALLVALLAAGWLLLRPPEPFPPGLPGAIDASGREVACLEASRRHANHSPDGGR